MLAEEVDVLAEYVEGKVELLVVRVDVEVVPGEDAVHRRLIMTLSCL